MAQSNDTAQYEVRLIDREGEAVLASFNSMDDAFDDCLNRWAARRAGGSAYAVRDVQTEQRWSYADIKDLRSPVSP